MNRFTFYWADCLEKVFPEGKPPSLATTPIKILPGEKPAWQLVYYQQPDREDTNFRIPFQIEFSGTPCPPRMRKVELIPSDFPCYQHRDENYLHPHPGLFPDLLVPMEAPIIEPISGQYRSIWLDFPDTSSWPAGQYTLHCSISAPEIIHLPTGQEFTLDNAQDFTCCLELSLEVMPTPLPAQTLIHTEWFHADCVADYYNTPVFSEEHWACLEAQITMAAQEHSVNLLLTPIFTPPLDTAMNGERTTVQLVDITLEHGCYSFDFSRLQRWCEICKKAGIQYIELPHWFTQWGAEYTPKILVRENGDLQQKFGWHVQANSAEYREFLVQFVPALRTALQNYGYDANHTYFHISDEPSEKHLENYTTAKQQVADLLVGSPIIDALSELEFYQRGLIEKPVPANDSIQPFIDSGIQNLWVYYCCGQKVNVPNRFFAMPSARNRIMGVLLYLYKIEGFLHWGYNFYNSAYSLHKINPFITTHAQYMFPSGDAFLVYPGDKGVPFSSIRAEVQRIGFDDMRLLQQLEKTVGREKTINLVHECAGMEHITFDSYPTEPSFFTLLHAKSKELL